MKAIDFRNETFESIRAKALWLADVRWEVYMAFREHGPGTTRCIAEKCGVDLLTLRPRATELYQQGFLALVEGQPKKKDGGVYMARTPEQFNTWRAEQDHFAVSQQTLLKV